MEPSGKVRQRTLPPIAHPGSEPRAAKAAVTPPYQVAIRNESFLAFRRFSDIYAFLTLRRRFADSFASHLWPNVRGCTSSFQRSAHESAWTRLCSFSGSDAELACSALSIKSPKPLSSRATSARTASLCRESSWCAHQSKSLLRACGWPIFARPNAARTSGLRTPKSFRNPPASSILEALRSASIKLLRLFGSATVSKRSSGSLARQQVKMSLIPSMGTLPSSVVSVEASLSSDPCFISGVKSSDLTSSAFLGITPVSIWASILPIA